MLQVRIVWTDGKSDVWKTLSDDPAFTVAYLEGYLLIKNQIISHYEIRLVEKEITD